MSQANGLLTLLMGPTIPLPSPPFIIEALQNIEITHDDTGRSGFQLSFESGRSGPLALVDSPLLSTPLLKPFSRLVIIITLNAMPRVLMDGIITSTEYSPGGPESGSTFAVTGEDVSIMMDLEEKSIEHPAQPELIIAGKIILSYAQYGLIPMVIPPPTIDIPIPIERTPTQQGTDLEYLNLMADRFGYVFFIIPGPAPLSNTAYWGPPLRMSLPQRALSVNQGSHSNVISINFSYNALSATRLTGSVEDRRSNRSLPVQTFASQRLPPLVSQPALTPLSKARTKKVRYTGLDVMQAFSRAQGITDSSVDNVATASGELDVLRYGSILWPRSLVGLRGAGYCYDGFWYVKRVTHKIKKGEYKQSFTLSREGMGSSTPLVVP